jgi:hypothetical protein
VGGQGISEEAKAAPVGEAIPLAETPPDSARRHEQLNRYLKQVGLFIGALIPVLGLTYDRIPTRFLFGLSLGFSGLALGLGVLYLGIERRNGKLDLLSPSACFTATAMLAVLAAVTCPIIPAPAAEARVSAPQKATVDFTPTPGPAVQTPVEVSRTATLPPSLAFKPRTPADADFARRLEQAVRDRLARTPGPEGLSITADVSGRLTSVAAQIVSAEVSAVLETPGALRKCEVRGASQGPAVAAAADLAEQITRQAAIMTESRTRC